jgi:NAD(P)-dependent dehydrogenase (short-subunit alcohol dehydrogenase family)
MGKFATGLAGRTALITGGSRGIGRATAELMAAEGCNLHLAARTQKDLEKAQGELVGAHGIQVHIHAVDLSVSAETVALADTCRGIDILVNNAGAIPPGGIDRVDEGMWREAWDLKVFGYINLARKIYADMRARGHGVIINVIGMAGATPKSFYVCGSAGNAALMAFTTAVGAEAADFGVRVVGVNPGLTLTERLLRIEKSRAREAFGDESRWQELTTGQPYGRYAKPEEIANLIVFLASDLGAYINAAVIPVDGGAHARGGR